MPSRSVTLFAVLISATACAALLNADALAQPTSKKPDDAQQAQHPTRAELLAEMKLINERLARIEKLLSAQLPEKAALPIPANVKPDRPAAIDGKEFPFDNSVGMVGTVEVEGKKEDIVFHYQHGAVFANSDLPMTLLEGKAFTVTLRGQFQLTEKAKVKILTAGGGVSHDVNWLFVDDSELGATGDDRSKQLVRELELEKGTHEVRWVLTGGTFRSNILMLQDATGELLPLETRKEDQELLKNRSMKQVRLTSRIWGWPIPRDWNETAGLIDPPEPAKPGK